MKRSIWFASLLVIFLLMDGISPACEDTVAKLAPKDKVAFELGRLAGKVGLSTLKLKNVQPGQLLVMTNAGYARFNDHSTLAALEGVGWATDTSLGLGNLLRIQTSRNHVLWFFLFDRKSGEGVYLEAPRTATGPLGAGILKTVKENISAQRLLADVMYWENRIKGRIFGGREFSIVTMANQWAAGAPYELLQAGSFHDHVCPGLTMGYMIANYLDRHLPLAAGERYHFISLSPSCRDDGLQVLFNVTVGKGGMTMIHITPEQRNQLSSKYSDLMGIYVAWDEKTQRGRAIALVFNWDLLQTKREGIGWAWRLQMNQELIDILNKPDSERFLTKVLEFNLPEGVTPANLIQVNMNSLSNLGLTDK